MTSTPSRLEGACHCGRVRVTAPADAFGVVACHCADCQKLHGNFFAMLVTDRASVTFTGDEHVRWYRSSPANERGFCAECGSRVAKRPVEGAKIMLSVGLFDRDLPRRLAKHVWAESKPAWYDLPPSPGVTAS